MPILEAHIPTDRADRYLVQFCRHAAAMGGGGHTARMHLHATMVRREVQVAAQWSETSGTVTFAPWGRCTLAADASTLTLRIDAVDEDGLAQISDVVTRDLERMSHRDPLSVTWQRFHSPDASPSGQAETGAPEPRRGFPRPHLKTILLTLAVILVVGLHVGLAGAVVAESRWTAAAVNVVAALVGLKIALVALARVGIRRRKAKASDRP